VIVTKPESDEMRVLEYVRAKFPNRWRLMIREAWMTGDYSALGLRENDDALLQTMRNTRGPTWLANIKI